MNCKPGDLAVIVRSAHSENIGLFVDVVEAHNPDSSGIILTQSDTQWMCRAKGKIRYESILGEHLLLSEGPIPDCCLKAIRPSGKPADLVAVRELEVAA